MAAKADGSAGAVLRALLVRDYLATRTGLSTELGSHTRALIHAEQLIGRLGGGRGHRTFAGTPVQIADTIEDWFPQGAADGFDLMPAAPPSGLERFVDEVVPILQERGLFRSDYTETTLRGHYSLARPANQYNISDVLVAAR